MFQIRFASLLASLVSVVAPAVLVASLATVLAATASPLSAQVLPPEVEWERTFPGIYSGAGLIVASAQQTQDGGYIVAGSVASSDKQHSQAQLLKVDGSGKLVWQMAYGGAGDEEGYAVCQTADLGYIVAGYTTSFDTNSFDTNREDVYLVKTDPLGALVWERAFRWRDWQNYNDRAFSVQETRGGGYVVAGVTYSLALEDTRAYLFKIDRSGNLLWEKTFGGNNPFGLSVQQTHDDGYIITGFTGALGVGISFSGVSDFYLLKTDTFGSLVWERTFGDEGVDELGLSGRQTQDRGYIVSGASGVGTLFLVKTDAAGGLVWQKTLDDFGAGFSTQLTNDGGYVVAGHTIVTLLGESVKASLIKVDSQGSLVWKKTLGRGVFAYSVQLTTDGGYIVAGYTSGAGGSGIYLIKLKPERLLLPPEPPANLRVGYLSAGNLAFVEWEASPSDADRYLVDRKVGYCGEWQQLREVAADTPQLAIGDPDLPPGEHLCYRVRAANSAGVSAPTAAACITTPPVPTSQLKLYVPGPTPEDPGSWVDLFPCDARFLPDHGTAVIVHGWNPPDNRLCWIGACHWDGDITSNQRGESHWSRLVAQQLHRRFNGEVNILGWDWLYWATNPLPNVVGLISGQAVQLANVLKTVLPINYSQPIHVMGHSLGTLVGSEACLELMEPHQSLPAVFQPRQLTLWDPPDGRPYFLEVRSNLTDRVQQLRARGVYVDLYAGLTNRGHHFANLVVDVPGDGHDVYTWYQTTIPAGVAPQLFTPQGAAYPGGGTVGFGTSALLGTSASHSDDGCAEGFGTLQFSHPDDWEGERARHFLLTWYQCALWDEPTKQWIQSFSQGSFGGDCDPSRCVSQSPTRIALGTAAVSGAGAGGAEAAELVASYHLEVTVSPDWDYLSFQYQFVAIPNPATLSLTVVSSEQSLPLWSVSSAQVIIGELFDSRRIPISAFHDQSVTIRFDLSCTAPGAESTIQDLAYWLSPTHNNQPPEADAGPDQVFAATGGGLTPVMFDGRGTRDADNDELFFRWLLNGNLLATGEQPSVMLFPGYYEVDLVVRDPADAEDRDVITIDVQLPFLRGDSNGDGTVDISDAINTLGYLFLGTSGVACADAADANDDGNLDISDPIATLGFLFLGRPGTLPLPVHPVGLDPTADRLGCSAN